MKLMALLLLLLGCGPKPEQTDLEKLEAAEKKAADEQNHRAGTPTTD